MQHVLPSQRSPTLTITYSSCTITGVDKGTWKRAGELRGRCGVLGVLRGALQELLIREAGRLALHHGASSTTTASTLKQASFNSAPQSLSGE